MFAPVAAHLARGAAISKLGPSATNFVRLDWPAPKMSGESIEGEIIYVDKFGNAIANIPAACLAKPGNRFEVFRGRRRLCSVEDFYQSVPAGKPVAVPGSSGYLEIAVNGGNASATLGLERGNPVEVRLFTIQSVAGRAGGGRKGK
jgi:S-adenosylmethionine hydrolase